MDESQDIRTLALHFGLRLRGLELYIVLSAPLIGPCKFAYLSLFGKPYTGPATHPPLCGCAGTRTRLSLGCSTSISSSGYTRKAWCAKEDYLGGILAAGRIAYKGERNTHYALYLVGREGFEPP
jgi:hypothetical protein